MWDSREECDVKICGQKGHLCLLLPKTEMYYKTTSSPFNILGKMFAQRHCFQKFDWLSPGGNSSDSSKQWHGTKYIAILLDWRGAPVIWMIRRLQIIKNKLSTLLTWGSATIALHEVSKYGVFSGPYFPVFNRIWNSVFGLFSHSAAVTNHTNKIKYVYCILKLNNSLQSRSMIKQTLQLFTVVWDPVKHQSEPKTKCFGGSRWG